jgi:L-ascorbate metabolism protein UlaG (beta-lactamase superfamily)
MPKYAFFCFLGILSFQCTMSKKIPNTNPQLNYITGVDTLLHWKENPISENRYVNHEFPMSKGFSEVLKWKSKKNPYKEEKKADTFRLKISPNLEDLKSPTKDGIFWLGHATFVIRVNGIQFITDPVFEKATVLKRWSTLPIKPKELPKTDYLLMSHDHRDHCDKTSLKKLAKWNPNMQFFSGLNMSKLLKKFLNDATGQEAGWYQQYQTDGFELYFLPTRHWAKRGLNDTNWRLWGSFILKINGLTFYFGGDSGYGSHYKDIARLFPQIDYAILGIGAYEPEWFMEDNHASPAKAYQAFKDLQAKFFIPMHYGTFDLSDEPLGKPQRELERIKAINQDSSILIPILGENLLK